VATPNTLVNRTRASAPFGRDIPCALITFTLAAQSTSVQRESPETWSTQATAQEKFAWAPSSSFMELGTEAGSSAWRDKAVETEARGRPFNAAPRS